MYTEMTLSITVQLVGGYTDFANIRDSSRTSRPHIAQTPDNVQRVNDMGLEDRRVTVKELSIQVGNWEESVCRVLKRLGLKKSVKTGF
jgi:hypothetical protein